MHSLCVTVKPKQASNLVKIIKCVFVVWILDLNETYLLFVEKTRKYMCKQAGKQWVMGEFYDRGMHRPVGAEGFMGLCLPLPLGDRQTFGQPLASSAR